MARPSLTELLAQVQRDRRELRVEGRAGLDPEELERVEELRRRARPLYPEGERLDLRRGLSKLVEMARKVQGERMYRYEGPEDEKNRELCAELVNQVWQGSELREMDNGQNGSVLRFKGGYNCRHHLERVGTDEVDGEERGSVEELEDADVLG